MFVPGLSTCLENGKLTLDGRRVATTWIDVIAMRLVEWAIDRKQSLILCPPEPFGALTALTAAAAHISSMTAYYERTGHNHALGSDRSVAVATSNFRARGIYRRLGVGYAPLHTVVPAAIRALDGTIFVLGGGQSWSTIFLSRPGHIACLDKVDLAVVELPITSQEEIEDLEVPLIVIAHNPADPLVSKLARNMPVFAWDDKDLGQLSSLVAFDGPELSAERSRLERVASGVHHKLIRIPAHAICENASLFWNDIGPLLTAGRHTLVARQLARDAFRLFYDLMHLAVPTAAYEDATRPIRLRLKDLEQGQRATSGEMRDLYLPMVAEELRSLAEAIGDLSPKTAVLTSVLRECAERGDDVLLVARTAEIARVYERHLELDSSLTSRVRVTNLWGVADERPGDVAIFVGMLPTSARYLYTTGLAREIVVLTYDAQSELEAVPGGFTERGQVQSAIAYQEQFTAWLSRDAAKADCWSRLSGEHQNFVDEHPTPPGVSPSSVEIHELPAAPDIPPNLWDGSFGSLADLEEGLRSKDPSDPAPAAAEHGGVVEVVRIEFVGGSWVLMDRLGTVTRYAAARGVPEAGCSVEKLSEGDHLVFFDGEARKDLLSKVLEVAGGLADYALPAAWIDYWRNALRRAYAESGSYDTLRRQLEDRGCVRETQTVRLWVVGQTIGPEDPEDIRRLGECLGDEALIDKYATINNAIELLRSAHVRLGQKLGTMARSVGFASASGQVQDDVIIDERSGLSAADFRDSIEILTVQSIAPLDDQMPYTVTGRLRMAREREVDVV